MSSYILAQIKGYSKIYKIYGLFTIISKHWPEITSYLINIMFNFNSNVLCVVRGSIEVQCVHQNQADKSDFAWGSNDYKLSTITLVNTQLDQEFSWTKNLGEENRYLNDVFHNTQTLEGSMCNEWYHIQTGKESYFNCYLLGISDTSQISITSRKSYKQL